MSLTVVVRETALRNLARIRGEDKDLFARARRRPLDYETTCPAGA